MTTLDLRNPEARDDRWNGTIDVRQNITLAVNLKNKIMKQKKSVAFWSAFQWTVVKRALIISAFVGTVLVLINHGPCLCSRNFEFVCLWQSVLTFIVPYIVSTVSSVMAISEFERDNTT